MNDNAKNIRVLTYLRWRLFWVRWRSLEVRTSLKIREATQLWHDEAGKRERRLGTGSSVCVFASSAGLIW